MCAPPSFCDLPGNHFISPCDEEVNCYKNPEHPKCQYASKCDLDDWKEYGKCKQGETCGKDVSLCLTTCDM